MDILVNTDGGNRGNPGPAAWAFVAHYGDPNIGTFTIQKSGFIESATNNEAEYRAMIQALMWLSDMCEFRSAHFGSGPHTVRVQSDSEVVVKQLLGVYQCRNSTLQPFFLTAIGYYELCKDLFSDFLLVNIKREQNTEPDALCHMEMDARGAVHPLKGKKLGPRKKKEAAKAISEAPEAGEAPRSDTPGDGTPEAAGFGGL